MGRMGSNVIDKEIGRASCRERVQIAKRDWSSDVCSSDLADDSKSNTQWSINGKLGQMIATGIGGSITGEGADLMIIDDPIKNSKEARSKTIRDNIWAEWEATLSTR